MRQLLCGISLPCALSVAAHADDERVRARSLLNWLRSASDANTGALPCSKTL